MSVQVAVQTIQPGSLLFSVQAIAPRLEHVKKESSATFSLSAGLQTAMLELSNASKELFGIVELMRDFAAQEGLGVMEEKSVALLSSTKKLQNSIETDVHLLAECTEKTTATVRCEMDAVNDVLKIASSTIENAVWALEGRVKDKKHANG